MLLFVCKLLLSKTDTCVNVYFTRLTRICPFISPGQLHDADCNVFLFVCPETRIINALQIKCNIGNFCLGRKGLILFGVGAHGDPTRYIGQSRVGDCPHFFGAWTSHYAMTLLQSQA